MACRLLILNLCGFLHRTCYTSHLLGMDIILYLNIYLLLNNQLLLLFLMHLNVLGYNMLTVRRLKNFSGKLLVPYHASLLHV